MVDCYMTPDMSKVEGYMLKRYTHLLMDSTNKWDAELDARGMPKPDMGQIEVDGIAYSALAKHIKEQG